MYSKILVTVVWAIGIICCFIMKKIQPDNAKLYCGYVILICGIFTAIAIASRLAV